MCLAWNVQCQIIDCVPSHPELTTIHLGPWSSEDLSKDSEAVGLACQAVMLCIGRRLSSAAYTALLLPYPMLPCPMLICLST